MRLLMATLADFATVREGLLTVVSAGLTQFFQAEYPAEVGFMLAGMLDIEPVAGGDIKVPFSVVLSDADGEEIWRGSSTIAGRFNDTVDLSMPSYVPITVVVRALIPREGQYLVTLTVAGLDPTVLPIRAVKVPAPETASDESPNLG
ncbi:hypothetical protein LK09_06110 [Microbacterium mangrovi]|uniref:Uncharacterized protein n=1 Tax=Microbacterium mangrovi TaxID=1348253 RepID=A0A0B2AAE4_9MICO|nr:hypothetical protein [Microbacterium mangrovi]KHK98547.1 hypothetical protein LK09_06110 [Microbacterium mangrovi]